MAVVAASSLHSQAHNVSVPSGGVPCRAVPCLVPLCGIPAHHKAPRAAQLPALSDCQTIPEDAQTKPFNFLLVRPFQTAKTRHYDTAVFCPI